MINISLQPEDNCQCLEYYEMYNFDDFIGFPISHPPKTTEAAVPQQPRKERNEAIFQQQCCRHPGQTGAVGPIGKNPPEINSKSLEN